MRHPIPIACLVAALATLWTPPVGAAGPNNGPAPAPLTLVEAVARTISEHPAIQVLRLDATIAGAAVLEAGGPFDTRLVAQVGHTHSTEPISSPERPFYDDAKALETETTRYRFGVRKQFRFGTVIYPSVEVSRGDNGIDPPLGIARVVFAVRQPLLRGRGADYNAADERVATLRQRSAELQLDHAIDQRVATTVRAYWRLVAARRALQVAGDSEARAQALTDEMDQLIAADERPAGDAVSLHALVAERAAARVDAEATVLKARHALGLAMGTRSGQLDALPDPADALPAPNLDWSLSGEARDRELEAALGRRADLAAARLEVDAATVGLGRAGREAEPQLDVVFRLGYTGLAEGGGGGPFVTPLWTNVRGVDAGFTLQLDWPIEASAGSAAEARLAAERARAELEVTELERRVRSEIVLAAAEVHATARVVSAADTSVARQREAVDQERHKLRAGLTTAIDVQLTEERLTIAQLVALDARLRHALALADLAAARGVLVEHVNDAERPGAGLVRPEPGERADPEDPAPEPAPAPSGGQRP